MQRFLSYHLYNKINILSIIVMNSTLRWVVAIVGWIVLLIIFGIWKSLDKEIGTSIIVGGIRGGLLGGGVFFLYQWAKSNPVRKDIVNNNDATKEKEIPHPSINADNFEKIAAEGMGDEKKEISEAEILNEEAANEEAHFFDKNIYRDNLLEQGCSKEAIDYLKNPIHVYSYMQKYKKTEEKILDAIKKGKLRGCYVGEALWVENKKI